jgi:hypothetical protein
MAQTILDRVNLELCKTWSFLFKFIL